MGSAQSYRASLSISEKFESHDVFNHCIVRLNKNDDIVRLLRNCNQCKNQLEGSAREISTPLRDNTTGSNLLARKRRYANFSQRLNIFNSIPLYLNTVHSFFCKK